MAYHKGTSDPREGPKRSSRVGGDGSRPRRHSYAVRIAHRGEHMVASRPMSVTIPRPLSSGLDDTSQFLESLLRIALSSLKQL